MPTVRIPLVGSYNQRGVDGQASLNLSEDQRFVNCVFNVVQNPITGKATVYVEKRPGWKQDSLVSAGNASTGFSFPQALNAAVSAYGDTNSTIYLGTTSVGTITGRASHFTETIISGTSYVCIKSSDGTGWYFAQDAADNLAYTCDGNNSTSITDIKVGGVASVAGLYVGQKLTAASNIAAGSRIVSINAGGFSAVLDTATTGGAFNDLATTKEPIAKITDSDFITTGTYISAFAEMDGYLFYSTDDGNLRNSDLNSITAYTSTGYLSPNMSPDKPRAVVRQRNMVGCFGGASGEWFFNAGNATGSPLQRAPQFFSRIGVLDQRSIAVLDNDVFLVSAPTSGDVGAYRIRDFAPIKISTPNVDRILGTAASSNGTIYTCAFRLGGYPYAGFFISTAADGPSSMLLLESGDNLLLESGDDVLLEDTPGQVASFSRFLVYNAQLNIWAEWDCNLATYISGVGSTSANKILATSRVNTSGKVYRIDPVADGELYQDDGSSFTMQVRTSRIDHGTGKRKFIPEIKLICDRQSAGTATLEASDDDYGTWFTVGTFDLTSMEPKITRCGSYKGGRSYRLSHSYNGPFRAEALEITYTEAT